MQFHYEYYELRGSISQSFVAVLVIFNLHMPSAAWFLFQLHEEHQTTAMIGVETLIPVFV